MKKQRKVFDTAWFDSGIPGDVNRHAIERAQMDRVELHEIIQKISAERDDAVVRLTDLKKALWEIHDKVQEALKLK